jgi:hypothetical protein
MSYRRASPSEPAREPSVRAQCEGREVRSIAFVGLNGRTRDRHAARASRDDGGCRTSRFVTASVDHVSPYQQTEFESPALRAFGRELDGRDCSAGSSRATVRVARKARTESRQRDEKKPTGRGDRSLEIVEGLPVEQISLWNWARRLPLTNVR